MNRSGERVGGRLLARNSVLNLAGSVVPMVVAIAAVPLLVKGLGTEQFGVLALAWMLLAYLGELGFGSTTTKFAAEALGAGAASRIGGIAWTTAAFQSGLGVLQGIGLALVTPWLVERAFEIPTPLWPAARLCFFLLAGALPVLGASKSFRGVLEAHQRFDLVTAVRIPATTANYLLPVVGVLAGWSLPAVFAAMLISRFAALVAYLTLTVRTFREIDWRPGLDRDSWRAMLGFGSWATLSSAVSPLLVYLDRFFVGALISMAAVAYYTAPYEIMARLLVVPMGVVGALYPAFSHLSGAGDRLRSGVIAGRSVKAILLVMAPVLLVLLGAAADALDLWLGPEFARESGLALQILAIGVFLNAAAHVPFALLHGSGRPDLPARFHLLELPIQLALAWTLVTTWGIPGAALAWTLRVTVDCVLLFGAAHRLDLLRVSNLVQERVFHMVAVIASAGGAAALGSGLMPGPQGRVALLLGVVAATLVVIWWVAMAPSERARFRAFLPTLGGG
jgi:O-antigen/teichoic acid export membrane protein